MSPFTSGLPKIEIEVNGRQLPASVCAMINAVKVQQHLGLPAQVELTFLDVGKYPDLYDLLTPGSPLRVDVNSFSEPLFNGHITALEWRYSSGRRQELFVRGYDPLYRLGQRQTNRTYTNLTPADLARSLADEIGLKVAAPQHGPSWARLYQHRQSDLALLQDMAERCGLYPTVRGAVLHLITLAGDNRDLPLRLGENLAEADVEMNASACCHSIGVEGWDPQRSIPVQARASQTSLTDLVSGKARPEQGEERFARTLSNESAVDQQQAAALAQAELDRRKAAQVVFRGVAEGDPDLQPGCSVRVEGLEPALNGRYVLTEVTHQIDARRGFISVLSTQPPQAPARTRAAVATLGIVIQVNDPDQCGRVRVVLPAYSSIESDWIGVLTTAAGPGKGLVALPNPGDTVLVLLLHEDPAQGLVLGGLYGQERLADSGIENGVVKRFTFHTADGQLITLDDRSLRLQNRAGSFIELSPDQLHIFSHTPLTIEAPGNSVTIKGSLIDFVQE
jgi:uncharacterized protein involved in type VI secretion and phage assembly